MPGKPIKYLVNTHTHFDHAGGVREYAAEGMTTVTDGTRTLDLDTLVGHGHNPYILIGYLPAERMLLYGDIYNPPSGPDPRDLARTNEYADNL